MFILFYFIFKKQKHKESQWHSNTNEIYLICVIWSSIGKYFLNIIRTNIIYVGTNYSFYNFYKYVFNLPMMFIERECSS